jgi:sigma-B regulation protein RsbU (phosphoserine phosphatase)
VDDVRRDGIMLGTTTDFMRNRSMLLVPLKIREEPLGVMAVLNKQRGSFAIDDQFLLQALADQGALSINNAMLTIEVGKQERLRRELQIARDIQKMLLPKECPIVPGFELAARGSSATEVGGDYYDFFWVDDDRLGIVVADVSGKGVPAALTVAMMRSVFRTQARGNHDVRDVLSRVNTFMGQDLRRDMFITCVYGILDIPARTFSWARAGHEPLIVAHEHEPIDILKPDGFALGVIDSPTFDDMLEVETIQLRTGDRLLIFTDGLTEAMNMDGEEFGMDRILQVMNHEYHLNGATPEVARSNGVSEVASEDRLGDLDPCDPSPSAIEPEDLRTLDVAVHEHVGDAPQSDDLTIVYLSAK